jgi:hypothetical protein
MGKESKNVLGHDFIDEIYGCVKRVRRDGRMMSEQTTSSDKACHALPVRHGHRNIFI